MRGRRAAPQSELSTIAIAGREEGEMSLLLQDLHGLDDAPEDVAVVGPRKTDTPL
jgi:hypothetical protein